MEIKRLHLDKGLSKLFNIVVNFYQLNNPKEVGYCTKIYSEYFKKDFNPTYFKANQFYFNKVNIAVVEKNATNVGPLAIKLVNSLKKLTDFSVRKTSKEEETIVDRTLFLLKGYNEEETKSRVLRLISDAEGKDLLSLGKKYLYNLLTAESMYGAYKEIRILKFFKKEGYKIYLPTEEMDKYGIDAVINNNPISIKSINYYKGIYKKRVDSLKEKFVVIIYEDDEIVNFDEVEKRLSQKGRYNTFNLKRF